MKYTEKFTQTPNISARKIKPEGIVLHHTAGSFSGSVRWCLKPESKVSYHCIVDTDGSRHILAKDNQRAWHAGASSFRGRSNCNDFTLGIAVSGDTNQRELNAYEIDSVAKWCVEKCKLHAIPITNITTHRAISPNRKTDVDKRAENAIMQRIRKILNIDC